MFKQLVSQLYFLLGGNPTAVSDTEPLPVEDQFAARESTQQTRLGGGKTPVVATVTEAGDTTIHTPAPGNRIILYWISAIANPSSPASPVIRVKIGSSEVYRVYAVSHWEPFEGEIDAPLIINLSTAGIVQVTAHIVESTP